MKRKLKIMLKKIATGLQSHWLIVIKRFLIKAQKLLPLTEQ